MHSVARRPLARLRQRTGRGVLRQLKRPAAPECASRTPCSAAPSPPAAAFDFRAHFCHSAPWKRTLSACDSRPTPRTAKSDFLSVAEDALDGKSGWETNHRPIDSARNSARVLAKARAFEPNKTTQHRTSAMSETSFLNNVPIPTSTGKENRYDVDRKDRS